MKQFKKFVWISCFLCRIGISYGQDTLVHRNLEFYLDAGTANSPLLKDNLNAITLNRIDSLINIATNKPYVQAIGQFLYAPAGTNWGYDLSTTNGGAYTGLIQANRNLLYRRNLQIQNSLNTAVRDSLVNTFRISANDLQKSIVDLYLTAYQDYQQMAIYGNLYRTLSNQNNVLKELLRKALFNQSDYLAFRVDWQQSEVNYEGAKVQFLQDLLALNALCNLPETGLVQLEKPELATQARFFLDDNPYLLRYRYDSVIVERNRRVVDIFYRPTLDLVANAGTNAISPDLLTRRFGYSVGLNLAIPIYNGNQRRLQYQKLDVSQLTIRNYRNQYLNRYTLQLRTVNEQIRVNQNLLALTQKQNTDVENLLTISQARLYQGDISAIDYLLIVQRFLNVKLTLNQLYVQQQRYINTFNYRNF